jgi:anti-anti-sigma regulatory factor
MMLRITIHDRAPMTSFVLEGKLVGPWVKELKQCWQEAVTDDPSTPLLVDLAAVTFVDHDGRALLKQMRHQGVRLLSHGVLIDAIVADIEAAETKREETASGC